LIENMTIGSKRFWIGAGFGIIATLVMSVLMVLIYVMGLSAMAEPIPLAQLARIIAAGLGLKDTSVLALVLAIPIHLAYGALWAGLVTSSTRQVTWWKGMALGLGLWAILIVFFLPMSGQATFAVATRSSVWITTLVLHLVYGLTFGVLAQRSEAEILPEPE
jgi:hypothetical protein